MHIYSYNHDQALQYSRAIRSPEYARLLNKLIAHYKRLVDGVIVEAGGTITFPMEFKPLEDYLSGYTINYYGFDNKANGAPKVEGFWEWESLKDGIANVFYNNNVVVERQRFTIVHEIMHIMQALDPKFLNFIDELFHSSIFPPAVIEQLMHRATDKAAAMYLMPNQHFLRKYKEVNTEAELASYFKVSINSLRYRLNELGLAPIMIKI